MMGLIAFRKGQHDKAVIFSLFSAWISCWTSSRVLLIQDKMIRDHSGYGLSHWETTLQCNIVSHWLGPYGWDGDGVEGGRYDLKVPIIWIAFPCHDIMRSSRYTATQHLGDTVLSLIQATASPVESERRPQTLISLHIEFWTRWQTFCRRHHKMLFIE